MNFEQAVTTLKEKVEWEKFFNLRRHLKGDMNKPSERFFKSRVLEGGLCSYSGGSLRYTDLPGRDCQFIDHSNYFVEMKGKQTRWHLKDVVEFRLVNGNSKKKKRFTRIPDTYAQFVMFYNLEAAFLIETDVLNRYIVDQWSGNLDVKVPVSSMTPLYRVLKKSKFSCKVGVSDFIDRALEEFYGKLASL